MTAWKMQDLSCMLYRPWEPIFFPRVTHDGEEVIYEVTGDFLNTEYQLDANALINKYSDFQGRKINLSGLLTRETISNLPLKALQQIGRNQYFSSFAPKHAQVAGQLIDIFMKAKDVGELMGIAGYLRDKINPQMFAYCLAYTIMHRNDTRGVPVANYFQLFPNKFIDCRVIEHARRDTSIREGITNRSMPIEIPFDYTGTDSDPEHRLAYWREDVGINLHHWHWHLVYPFSGITSIVNKDRRGELFFWMHHQIMARYNVERLCNDLPLVKRLMDFKEIIPEAYFPKLTNPVAGRAWPSRPPGLRLQDIDRPDLSLKFDITDLQQFLFRILNDIDRGEMHMTRNTYVAFEAARGNTVDPNTVTPAQLIQFIETNNEGINRIGNMLESSILTVNQTFYGDLHNMMHLAIAFITDPENKYLEPPGVMSEPTTAMRDPIFYRWHGMVNDIFLQYKNTLTPYTQEQLTFPGVRLSAISIASGDGNTQFPANQLRTFWMKTDVDLSRGLDFSPRNQPVFVRLTHLNHFPYDITISIDNTSGALQRGTARIFLGPVLNQGDYAFDLVDQKNLMIEIDRFVIDLGLGLTTVTRKSSESAVGLPFEQTFRDLNVGRPAATDVDATDAFNYCGCGWPEHMLVPKGKRGGYTMVLYCMISNFQEDMVYQDITGCRTGVTFCGIRDRQYPDSKPMGYPFDRRIRDNIITLSDFVLPCPNMAMTRVDVIHDDRTYPGQTTGGPSVPLPGSTSTPATATEAANQPTNTTTTTSPASTTTTSK